MAISDNDRKMVEGLKKLLEGIAGDDTELRDKLLNTISDGEKSFEWLSSAKERTALYLLMDADGNKPFVGKRAEMAASFVGMLTSDSLFDAPSPRMLAACQLAFCFGMLAERDGWCVESND